MTMTKQYILDLGEFTNAENFFMNNFKCTINVQILIREEIEIINFASGPDEL